MGCEENSHCVTHNQDVCEYLVQFSSLLIIIDIFPTNTVLDFIEMNSFCFTLLKTYIVHHFTILTPHTRV